MGGCEVDINWKECDMGISLMNKCLTNRNQPAPNPSPSRWELLEKKEYDGGYVLRVRYLDCTNFEGEKIMVFRGGYRHKDYLDPHFSESIESPIARYRPDNDGWAFACALASSLR